jgi:hypothetical protein
MDFHPNFNCHPNGTMYFPDQYPNVMTMNPELVLDSCDSDNGDGGDDDDNDDDDDHDGSGRLYPFMKHPNNVTKGQ